MKRPTMYVQWRQLWHEEAKLLGWMVAWRFKAGRIEMDSDLWKQINRVRRIEARLKIESEVKDASWCASLLQMIRDHQSRDGG